MVTTHDNSFSANVGDMMAAAMAAAGMIACDFAGRIRCETDYLAISGATFPDVSVAELEAFNRATLKSDMSEADEFARYSKIAEFFHRRPSCR